MNNVHSLQHHNHQHIYHISAYSSLPYSTFPLTFFFLSTFVKTLHLPSLPPWAQLTFFPLHSWQGKTINPHFLIWIFEGFSLLMIFRPQIIEENADTRGFDGMINRDDQSESYSKGLEDLKFFLLMGLTGYFFSFRSLVSFGWGLGASSKVPLSFLG